MNFPISLSSVIVISNDILDVKQNQYQKINNIKCIILKFHGTFNTDAHALF